MVALVGDRDRGAGAGVRRRPEPDTVTATDIQRLQDDVYQAGSDLSRLRSSNPESASRLQSQLDELRDEVIYLKVRLRREGSVPRTDYLEVRDRVQALRADARGDTTTERRGAGPAAPPPGESPAAPPEESPGGRAAASAGTTAPRVRRRRAMDRFRPARRSTPGCRRSSVPSTAQVEDRFEATTVADLYRGNEVLIPAGSVLRGVVRTVDPATRTDRKGQLTVSFDQITVRGRTYPMRGTVSQALESEGMKGEIGRIGAGAGVGAIIGGILGGTKGALIGVLIGGGGTIAATEGKDVTLEPGTILRVRLDTPPNIR